MSESISQSRITHRYNPEFVRKEKVQDGGYGHAEWIHAFIRFHSSVKCMIREVDSRVDQICICFEGGRVWSGWLRSWSLSRVTIHEIQNLWGWSWGGVDVSVHWGFVLDDWSGFTLVTCGCFLDIGIKIKHFQPSKQPCVIELEDHVSPCSSSRITHPWNPESLRMRRSSWFWFVLMVGGFGWHDCIHGLWHHTFNRKKTDKDQQHKTPSICKENLYQMIICARVLYLVICASRVPVEHERQETDAGRARTPGNWCIPLWKWVHTHWEKMVRHHSLFGWDILPKQWHQEKQEKISL